MSKQRDTHVLLKAGLVSTLLFGTGVGMYYLVQPDPAATVTIPYVVEQKHRATLNDVRRDWGIEGRLDCRVVQK